MMPLLNRAPTAGHFGGITAFPTPNIEGENKGFSGESGKLIVSL
jgi:hypothetical protein